MIALIFPGQGSQFVGMGSELATAFPRARETFEEADDTLGMGLSSICFSGPVERLVSTEVCQPAMLTASIASLRVAREHGLVGDLAFGHSLGEYAALVAVGSLEFGDALRIVAERGAAMDEAGRARPGAMAALLGIADGEAERLCESAGEVWLANYNCPGQVVASGTLTGIDRLLDLVAERGGKATRLSVSGAFHSPLMEPAARRLAPALESWEPAPPAIPFLSTVSAALEPPGRMLELMLAQLTAPVRFGATVEEAVRRGADRFVELGPGRVLSGLVRRARRDVMVAQVGQPDDVVTLAASIVR